MRKHAGPFLSTAVPCSPIPCAPNPSSADDCGPHFCHYDPFAEMSPGPRADGRRTLEKGRAAAKRRAVRNPDRDNVVTLFKSAVNSPAAPEAAALKPAPAEAEAEFDFPGQPLRRYDCENYNTCLGLAAALDWNSFSCRGCGGSVNQQLLWRAHCSVRRNKALQKLCCLPPVTKED